MVIHPLKAARESCGFSKQELARRLGLTSTSQIVAWENGMTIPDDTHAGKLAIALIFDSAQEVQRLCQEWIDHKC